MRHVIREAGLSAGAVYLYYKGKDELILAAISTYMAELRELLLPILANKEMLPPSAFARKITAAIASHTQRRGPDLNTIILMCWSEAQTNSEVKGLIAGFQGVFREALTAVARQWQKRGELPIAGKPRDIAKLCFRSSLSFIAQSALVGGIDTETAARAIAGLVGGEVISRRRKAGGL